MGDKGVRRKWILAGVVAGIIILALCADVVIRLMQTPKVNRGEAMPEVSVQGYLNPDDPNALPTVEGGTRIAVATSVPAPNTAGASSVSGVAVPVKVMATGSVSFRQFDISGANGKFSPDTIVVNEGDVIDINLTSEDGTYSMYFPDFAVSLAASRGKTAHVQFQATNYGQYQFYCNGSCVGEPKGTLIVNKK